jgi:hypothetical protein
MTGDGFVLTFPADVHLEVEILGRPADEPSVDTHL